MLDAIGDTTEDTIFDTKIVQDFYNFQWDSYAIYIHMFGFVNHVLYVLAFFLYVNEIYLRRNFEARVPLVWCMLICLIYPTYYDTL